MTDFKTKKFIYRNSVNWRSQKKGLLTSYDRPSLEVATPQEFKGHAGIWSPEDLFVAAVNACMMTTFLYFAERERIDLLSYESEAEGVLERVDNRLIFSGIKVRPKICIKVKDQIEKVEKIITLSEKSCLISNSIKSNVEVIPKIE